MREAESHSYFQICALLDHARCIFERTDNDISIKLASAHGTVLILSFYQLLKDSWHLSWHKAAWCNIKSRFAAHHCCVPCGCGISVWHKGPKGRFTVSSYSDWKHRLNLTFRHKTLIQIIKTSQQNREKSDSPSPNLLREKTKSSKATGWTELGLECTILQPGVSTDPLKDKQGISGGGGYPKKFFEIRRNFTY